MGIILAIIVIIVGIWLIRKNLRSALNETGGNHTSGTSTSNNDGDLEKEYALRASEGEDVQKWCESASVVKKLPYICFLDWEIDSVEKAMNAQDDLEGTISLLLAAVGYLDRSEKYTQNSPLIAINRAHAKVWIDELCNRADKGSIYACAAVYSNYFPIRDYPEIRKMIAENLGDRKDEFKLKIDLEVRNKNPHAILAYAWFELFGDEEKAELRKTMFYHAGQLGLADGYDKYIFTMKNWSTSPEAFEAALLAAKLNNSPRSYEYQYRIGQNYWFGEGYVSTPNKEEGLKWLNLSASNGDESAKYLLDILRNSGEI